MSTNRQSGAPYSNNVDDVNSGAASNTTPDGTFISGTSGSLSLLNIDTNTTSPTYGEPLPVANAANYTLGTSSTSSTSNFGLGANWSAVAPVPNPSPGTTSLFVYTVCAFQAASQQVPQPAPSAQPNASPTPQPSATPTPPLFNPQFTGSDSLAISEITAPLISVSQGVNATINASSVASGAVPGQYNFGIPSRLWADYTDPSSKYLYMTQDGAVRAFQLLSNGDIHEVGTYSTGAGTARAKTGAFDSTGSFFYVACGSGHVAGYKLDGFTGQLTPVPGSPFSTGGKGTLGISFDRSGKYLYACNQGPTGPSNPQNPNDPVSTVGSSIAGFRIDPQTGALQALPNFPIGVPPLQNPAYVACHPSKDVLYVTNQGATTPFQTQVNQLRFQDPASVGITGNFISTYKVDPQSGQLTLLQTQPNTAGDRNMQDIKVGVGGNFVYVTDAADPVPYDLVPADPRFRGVEARGPYAGGVSVFRVNSDGSLSFNRGLPYGNGTQDPNGLLLIQLNALNQ